MLNICLVKVIISEMSCGWLDCLPTEPWKRNGQRDTTCSRFAMFSVVSMLEKGKRRRVKIIKMVRYVFYNRLINSLR